MKSFKVNKCIEKKPIIFGLTLDAFKIFGTLAGITILVCLPSMSFMSFLVMIVLIAIEHVLCNVLIEKRVLKQLSDENLPDHIMNNL